MKEIVYRLWLIWAWRGFSDTTGASPNQANPEHIVDLDMVGTGYAVDAFGEAYDCQTAEPPAGTTGRCHHMARASCTFHYGTDLLIDGGVIAAIRTGEYQLG